MTQVQLAVIPAKAGIQDFCFLDASMRWHDNSSQGLLQPN
jgi:hypothetical protein